MTHQQLEVDVVNLAIVNRLSVRLSPERIHFEEGFTLETSVSQAKSFYGGQFVFALKLKTSSKFRGKDITEPFRNIFTCDV